MSVIRKRSSLKFCRLTRVGRHPQRRRRDRREVSVSVCKGQRPREIGQAKTRRTEVRPIFKQRAISDLLTPARWSFLISAAWTAAVAGRPRRFPFCRAWARPARVRSRSTWAVWHTLCDRASSAAAAHSGSGIGNFPRRVRRQSSRRPLSSCRSVGTTGVVAASSALRRKTDLISSMRATSCKLAGSSPAIQRRSAQTGPDKLA